MHAYLLGKVERYSANLERIRHDGFCTLYSIAILLLLSICMLIHRCWNAEKDLTSNPLSYQSLVVHTYKQIHYQILRERKRKTGHASVSHVLHHIMLQQRKDIKSTHDHAVQMLCSSNKKSHLETKVQGMRPRKTVRRVA
ncbi:hypothetical protein N657DRAFT_45259 [Parathielavia appendiculata]|uniref:Uncharacterized protein n=1 Tax=Parathielavia appendiculata TaxID=2587402 RepID=A0AAN6U9E8_9PEZI|nr:hypothetical protein N657DRAFT_45259 [Parathielavia appendiculata]